MGAVQPPERDVRARARRDASLHPLLAVPVAAVRAFKYVLQSVKTLQVLAKERPDAVHVQNPPFVCGLVVASYGAIARTPYVIEHHTAAFGRAWAWAGPLQRLIARRRAHQHRHERALGRCRGGVGRIDDRDVRRVPRPPTRCALRGPPRVQRRVRQRLRRRRTGRCRRGRGGVAAGRQLLHHRRSTQGACRDVGARALATSRSRGSSSRTAPISGSCGRWTR